MPGHKQRVGCTAWSHHVLATGSRDRTILLRDVRQQDPFTMKLTGHRSEVRPLLPCLAHRAQGYTSSGEEAVALEVLLLPAAMGIEVGDVRAQAMSAKSGIVWCRCAGSSGRRTTEN